MKLYILVEDTRREKEFESEHGLSVYFEKDGKKFVLDLGQSSIFLRNAQKLNLDLKDVDYLVFSHGHYDHTGGLPFFPINNKLRIIAHPHSLLPKYDGERYIGFPNKSDNVIMELKENPIKLTEHVWFLGQIPGERKTNLGHYIKGGIQNKDFLLDDSALVILGGDRLVIIAGCAHSGIVNIVKSAIRLFHKKEIILIGGFHMLRYSKEEIEETITRLKELNVAKVYPGHCTGNAAIEALLASFKGERLYSGKVLEV
ncbi:MAG: MBL fold metallo-hydrolase [Nanoarchaeota archaeon]|nr:MBL fold metallo-hydrolase [Nanoarchaeota archaeon]MBU1005722.1 MBL fold metallo-hydrolase [Nanoarchaeota archaeon]MBU1945593.1 MBL fold metallo-hydrolase [Nanoarchaeota archaeon]